MQADDILIRVNKKDKAEAALAALESLKDFNLMINKDKPQIMPGPKFLSRLDNLLGVTIVKKVKYLGYTLTVARNQLFQSAQASIKRHTNLIRKNLAIQD